MSRRTALIDADGLIYITVYCKQLKDDFGVSMVDSVTGEPIREVKTLDDCKKAMDDIIKNILVATQSDDYLLFLTVGKNFRYEVYPEYKANRKYGDKPEHFDRIKEYLITEYKAVYNHGLEADDLCLIYRERIPNSFICSPDKDIVMLEGSHYNYSKYKWITVTKAEASKYFWKSMITGDSADNIKGVPGKGPKFADNLINDEVIAGYNPTDPQLVLKEYIDKFGEEDGIYEFYKNYRVLKIKSKSEGLEYADPIKFKVRENEQTEGDTW